ncbi:Inner kinetochore subunit fta4 [Schizosaccharomyces pombe]
MERQIRLLNRPMRPPKDWKLPLKSGQLSESVVETVFQRLQLRIQKHAKLNYSHQATQHVAAQIRKLYEQNSAIEDITFLNPLFYGEIDLSNLDSVKSLPHPWPFQKESRPVEKDEEQEKFNRLTGELLGLLTTLSELEQERSELEQIEKMLEPFEDGPSSIHTNMWKKNPELISTLNSTNTMVAKINSLLRGVSFPSLNNDNQEASLEDEIRSQLFEKTISDD